ncbi:MAG: biotin transporter BioY [Armatimonadota bacterium]|nr:biotin transporter BioY [bacterium]
MHILTQVKTRTLSGRRAVVASLIGAAFTAVCAQVAFYLPGNPVPVTAQVFAVICCGMVLGSKYGALSQIEYLVAGLMGAPIFTGFKAGPIVLAGPTAGYLIGFICAAYVVGRLLESSPRRSFAPAVIGGLMGVGVIYAFGAGWLAVWGGSAFPGFAAWIFGAAPFIGVDAVKVVLAAMLCVGRK